jgi:ELWxxDGT repeat protein/VCBS repeat-containing protein
MSVQFFLADDGVNGRELWFTDGTAAGTFLLRDLYPGTNSGSYGNFVQSNGIMYFTASDGSGTHLWRSDGTQAGTFALTSSTNGDNASNLINVHGTLFYLGSDSVHGAGLFKSDGTPGGTSFVAAVSGASKLTVVGNSLFFEAHDPANGYELWISDGTSPGTHLVADIFAGTGSSGLSSLTASGGKLYFIANDGSHGSELWVSDGTAAGTKLVRDTSNGVTDGSIANLFSAGGGRLFYTADQGGGSGRQLWSTDGDSSTKLTTGSFGASIANPVVFNNQFYFIAADSPSGVAIYTSDGSGYSKLVHLSSFGGTFYNLGGKLMFTGDDGTNSGFFTFDGASLSYGGAIPSGFSQPVVANGQLFFVATDPAHGYELWVTDGTAAGTRFTADINPGSYNADISNINPAGSGVVFSATSPTVGTELFFSDGTAAGTRLLREINTLANHSPSLNFGSGIATADGKAFFAADDNANGNELWVSDGTAAGSHQVADLRIGASASNPQSFFAFGTKMFFTADDGVNGRQLYVSDGSAGGTVRLTSNGVNQVYNDATRFFSLGGNFYFLGYFSHALGGHALFTTDGVTVTKVANLYDLNSPAYQLDSGRVVFRANDGVNGYGLYTFDGTSVGFVATTNGFDNPVVRNGKIYYGARDGASGYELWVSDGTALGTHVTADINPGGYDADIANITGLGSGVVFTATDPTIGNEVFISDGTSVGTRMLSDVNATGNRTASLGFNSGVAAAGGLGFFASDDNIRGNEMWVSDGTAAGTHIISDLRVGANASNPQNFYAFGGKMYFTADDGVNGRQLYVSDGSAGGMVRLTTNGVNQVYNDANRFFTLNGNFYFLGYFSHALGGHALFTTDGVTVTKVANLYDLNSNILQLDASKVILRGHDGSHGYGLYTFDGSNLSFVVNTSSFDNAVVRNGKLYYSASDGGTGYELWVSDGSAAGTHITADINPGAYDAAIANVTGFGTGVVFTATDPTIGNEVFISDGTSAGTRLLADVNATANQQVSMGINSGVLAAGGKAYFAADEGIHGNELWVSDGTVAGTHLVKDLRIGANAGNPQSFYTFGDKVYFTADDGVTGRQLYVSDGTEAGTARLTTTGVNQVYNDVNRFFTLGGNFYFLGYFNHALGGHALFTTDGTTVTKVLDLYDLNSSIYQLGSGKVIFRANDGVNGYGLYTFDGAVLSHVAAISDFELPMAAGGKVYFNSAAGGLGRELWVSDGTTAGTQMIKDINVGGDSHPNGMTAAGSLVFFLADDGSHGQEIWVTDGTSAGTKLLADVNEGLAGSGAGNLTAVGSKLFFTANTFSEAGGALGVELWVSDGTVAGTVLVKDIRAGSQGSAPHHLFAFNGKAFFTAYDDVNGWQLWSSDGTAAGTALVGGGDGMSTGNPGNVFIADASHFFFTGNDGLFYSDGTAAGTHYVTSLPGFDAAHSGIVNGKFYFQNYSAANGYEMWVSDGTSAGTMRVSDAVLPNSSGASRFVVAGGSLYFTASDGSHGEELFVSDGTTAGTRLVSDIYAGAPGSAPRDLFGLNNKLIFSADDGVNGRRLYSSDGVSVTPIGSADNGADARSPSQFLVADATHFYFQANSGLFYSDGTTAGTHFVAALPQGFDRNYAGIVGGELYFRNWDGTNGWELWASDGTAAGTQRVTDTLIPNSSNASSFLVVGANIFFVANDGSHGAELFVSDGTSAGTHLLIDLNPGTATSNVGNLFALDGKLYFTADAGVDGRHLFRTDGSSVVQIDTADAGRDARSPSNIVVADATHFYFYGSSGLFYSDGSTAGTHFVIAPPQGFDANYAKVIDGKLYFRNWDSTNGWELWTSDGTTAGTHIVTDTATPFSSNPGEFHIVDNFPPSFENAQQVALNDRQTTRVFNPVIIGDPDAPAQTLTVTVTPSDPAVGEFTAASLSLSGFVGGGVNGAYTFTGTAAQATSAIETLVYKPNSNRLPVGQSETVTFTVVVDDGQGGSVTNAETTVTVTSVNDAPTPLDDAASVNEDATAAGAAGALLANDSDVDVGDTATLKVAGSHFGATADTPVPASGTANISGTYGVLHIAADGSYSYTPSSGPAQALAQGQSATEAFSYTIADAHGATTSAMLTFTIAGQEDGPVAVHDEASATEDALLSVGTRVAGLLGNDTDVDAGEQAQLRITGAHSGSAVDTPIANGGSAAITGALGTLTLGSDGSYSYLAGNGAAQALALGQIATDTFSYSIVDPQNGVATNTVTLTVTGANDAPVATSEIGVAVDEDSTASAASRAGGLLGNDSDVDTDETASLKVTAAHSGVDTDTLVPGSNAAVTVPGSYGDLVLKADGTYSYTPNKTLAEQLALGAHATETFTYTVSDVNGATATATISFDITGTNDAPTAQGQGGNINEDGPALNGSLASRVSDIDTGETSGLTLVGFHVGSNADTPVPADNSGVTITGTYLSVVVHADLTYSFLADRPASQGLAAGTNAVETFHYTVADAHGATATNIINLNINGVNDAPTGANDSAVVQQDSVASASGRAQGVLGNDSDPDNGETATLVVSGGHYGAAADTEVTSDTPAILVGGYGTLTLHADGHYAYAANGAAARALPLGVHASDLFSYTLKDAQGATATATLSFDITGIDDAPTPAADNFAVTEDLSVSAGARAQGVLANDSDPDTGTAGALVVTGGHAGSGAGTDIAVSGPAGAVIASSFGTLTLHDDGTFTYVADGSSAQALAAGVHATDSFT